MEIKHKSENMNKSVPDKKSTNMLLAAFIIFIFPLIAIFLGIFLGGYIANILVVSVKTFQIIGGIAGLILAGIVIKLFDKFSKIDEKTEKIHWDDL